MPTYTPEKQSWQTKEENAPQPIVAIGYEKDGKLWRVSWASTAKTELDFTHCLDGMTEFTDAAGHSRYDAETQTLTVNRSQPQKLWFDKNAVKVLKLDDAVVSRSQLAEAGITVISKPINDEDPTYDAHHEDTCHTEYCRICKGHWMDEVGCNHLGWAESGGGWIYGCGTEDVDLNEAKRSIYDLLDLIPRPLVAHFRDLMAEGTFELQAGNDWRSDVTIRIATTKGRKLRWPETLSLDYLETLCGEDEDTAREIFWPGLAWLRSLDKHTPHYTALTQGWLHEYLKRHAKRSTAFVMLPEEHRIFACGLMQIKRANRTAAVPAYPVHLYVSFGRGNSRREIWRIDPGTFKASAKTLQWKALYPLLKAERDGDAQPWNLPDYALLPRDVISEWKDKQAD